MSATEHDDSRLRSAALAEWEARLVQRERDLETKLSFLESVGTSSGTTSKPTQELKHRTGAAAHSKAVAAAPEIPESPSKRHVPPLMSYIHSGKFLRSAVFGGLDGLTTSIVLICSTSGLVRGDAADKDVDTRGGHITTAVLFTLGMANLVADAFSMGMGDFLSSLAESEHDDAASTPVAVAAPSDKCCLPLQRLRWHQDAAVVEAFRNGAAMFVSFVGFGIVPLATYAPLVSRYALTADQRFAIACLLGLLSLFLLGVLKGYVTAQAAGDARHPRRAAMLLSGAKMVLMGSIASVISFVVSLELHVDH